MDANEDLPTLIKQKNHLGVLRHIRVQQLRKPKLVVEHGQSLLGKDLSRGAGDQAARLSILEQLCLAALDLSEHELAEKCLAQLRTSGVSKDSARFRRLLARCLEASGDYEGAEAIYNDMLKENPASLVALQRKYCIARAQQKKPEVVVAALNDYLGQQMSDASGWYEMAKLRMSYCDYKNAAYALEHVVLACPLDANIHLELAEVYATIGGLENCKLARRHMAQSLELDASNIRAQFGLVSVAKHYLEEAAAASKKDVDKHEIEVAKELVRYGADEVLKSYKGKEMFAEVKKVIGEYVDNLDG